MKTIYMMIMAFAAGILITTNIMLISSYGNKQTISVVDIKKEIIEQKSLSNCFNSDLQTTANCIRDWIKPWYNYTVRDDIERTLEEIKENGGDCFDYTWLYKNMMEYFGFSTERENAVPGHTFLIAWDENKTGYCTMDQLNINCIKFGK